MLRRELERVEDAQDFVEVAACAHRVAELELDFLVWTDDEYCADGGVVCRSAACTTLPCLRRQHTVELRDLELRIADHWVVHFRTLRLLYVAQPLDVIADRVHAQSDDFGVPLGEFWL